MWALSLAVLAACEASAPEVEEHSPPAAILVTLEGSLDEWWSPARRELGLGDFEFESAVLGAGPTVQLTWPAWAPSAALAGLWAGRSPAELGRTHAADAGSLRPRRTGPFVAEQFTAAGWRTWIAPGSDDLALWPPSWLGFESGLAPGEQPVEAWPAVLASEWRAEPRGLLAAVVLPLAELEPIAADRVAAWRAWSVGGEASTAVFDAGEVAGLARGDADAWESVRQRTARRRGRPEALAFEALEQGARLMAADRWLVKLEGVLARGDFELWVTVAGAVGEGRGEPRTPVFLGPGPQLPGDWPEELGPNDVRRLPLELGARVGVAVGAPEPPAAERVWGADPNRPYQRSDADWQPVPDPFDSEAAELPASPEWTAGWRLTWPERVPPGELRVKLQVGEGDALQGWWVAERDGSWRAGRPSKPDRAEWRFPAGQAPRWLAIALERRGAPVLLEVSLDGRPIQEEQFLFQGEPLGGVALPRLVDPGIEPSADLDTTTSVRMSSRPSGAELNLDAPDLLSGARRWPPGILTWEQPIDPAAPLFLDWRAPGRPALAIYSGEAFRPASELLFDQRPDRGERTTWVLWPVEPLDAHRSRSASAADFTPRGGDLNLERAAVPDAPATLLPFAPDPTRWDLRPLGAPFASDADLWSRPVTPEIWEQRQRELRRAPGR
ncbi:MAG: hypothetical protein ACYS26_07335 [Planctomycetota bacterium]|jgi:hypothetical protein